jgi:hypothetical protein
MTGDMSAKRPEIAAETKQIVLKEIRAKWSKFSERSRWRAGTCSANCDPETPDLRSGRRVRKSSTEDALIRIGVPHG